MVERNTELLLASGLSSRGAYVSGKELPKEEREIVGIIITSAHEAAFGKQTTAERVR